MSTLSVVDKRYYLWYAFLVILQCLWTNTEAGPPTLFRMAYWIAVIGPAVMRKGWLPAIIALFYTICCYGYAYGYMPYESFWYILFVCFGLALLPKVNEHISIPKAVIILMGYSLFIDIITSFQFSNLPQTLLILIGLCLVTERDNEDSISKMSLAFAVSSLALSVLFFMTREQFAQAYMTQYADNLERSGWTDPNYFGMVISFGGISSLFELIRGKYEKKWMKYLYFATLLMVVPVSILNASRGAVLAFVASCVILLLYSNQSKWRKISITFLAVGFMILLYSTNVFDLLLYRINSNDVDAGSGRIDIWKLKLSIFFERNPLQIICGLGNYEGLRLGGGGAARGFHNDYVAFLVEYGVLGLVLFLSMLYYPLKNLKRHSLLYPFVLSGVIAIALYGVTLEPYSTAGLAYWMFYLYVYMISQCNTYADESSVVNK